MTAELTAVRCSGCGGTVRMVAGRKLPSCLFCGADAADLVPTEPPEGVEQPSAALPFACEPQAARASFVAFASSSFWYPSDLRSAKLELRPLMLPAWAWSGRVETHWTGLVSAGTRSGKEPISGVDDLVFGQILVPASRTLRTRELASLGAWDESVLAPFDPATSRDPMELSELTRSAARQQAQQEMERRHQERLTAERSLLKIRASSLVSGLEGRPVMVPIFVGAYRYGDRTFRVLVNGQSGKLVADAPKSVWKMVGVALLIILVFSGLFAAFTICFGGAAVVSS